MIYRFLALKMVQLKKIKFLRKMEKLFLKLIKNYWLIYKITD